MGEEKRNKVIAAATINAILLVVILVAVIIAQVVEISIKRNRKNALLQEYNETYAALQEMEDLRDKLEDGDEQFILSFYELSDHLYLVRLKLEQMGVELPPSTLE